MGKGYKRKTRWRTLNIGAPPGEEDEEAEIRNGSKNGQPGHKTGRTDSAGSATSDYASDYASAVSNSRREDSGGSRAQPKIIFNENEYTRITTPRQDVLFKKGYLSRKKVSASTASTSATPSTTESQSASHSTADGSETTEDQQLLDCKENGAEEYPAMMNSGLQMTYGTFYDHASGYYYEYPVMVVGPGVPEGPPMHNVLTAVPCGPVPLRPIEWVNPAFVPKYGNEQYCVVDYQTPQLGQYPTLVDETGLPLAAVACVNSNGIDELTNQENNAASWTESGQEVAEEQPSESCAEPLQNGTINGTSSTGETEEEATVAQQQNHQQPVSLNNSEIYLETALAQQLHVTHVPVPPTSELYVYPGHYMFGPSLVNVNGVTIQSGPMVRNYGIIEGPMNIGACAKRRKRKLLNRRKSRQPPGPDNVEDEQQDEEDGSELENIGQHQDKPGVLKDVVDEAGASSSGCPAMSAASSQLRPLNPDCPEFRPVLASMSTEPVASSAETSSVPSSSGSSSESPEKEEKMVDRRRPDEIEESSPGVLPLANKDAEETSEKSATSPTEKNARKLSSRDSEDVEAAPVDFAAEVFANVSVMAERALAPRSVVEGTPMETEIGLDATAVNFQEIANDLETKSREDPLRVRSTRASSTDEEERGIVANGHGDALDSFAVKSLNAISEKRSRECSVDKRGSRSESPGVINRTTTPINANSQRLPKSYESLVTRNEVSSSLPCLGAAATTNAITLNQSQVSRCRRYSSKGAKFVREPTPGPDLEDLGPRVEIARSEERTSHGSLEDEGNDPEMVAIGIEVVEESTERHSLATTEDSFWARATNNADVSNEDSGVESQPRLSGHPITDAVTEWLQRANSPEMFVSVAVDANRSSSRPPLSESEPEDDELENEEPPKNLQGNPMPALSANGSDYASDPVSGSSRLAGYGKFATVVRAEATNETKIRDDVDPEITRDKSSSCRKKRRDCNGRTATAVTKSSIAVSKMAGVRSRAVSSEAVSGVTPHESSSHVASDRSHERGDEVCEFTEDRVAGMRVAKSSRTRRSVVSTRRGGVRRNDRASRCKVARNRQAPIENVEIKVRRMTGDEKDEGIVEDNDDDDDDEDDELDVRTFEKGRILVSIEGKVLPVDNYHIMLKSDNLPNDESDELPNFRKITCEKSRNNDQENENGSSTTSSTSKRNSLRNSLGSIEEPDVLECWEIETVEPITTPKKRIPTQGVSLTGEDPEDDSLDDTSPRTTLDPVGMEIVRKYYRLEAMQDSVTSIEDESDSRLNNNNNTDDVVIDVSRIPISNSQADKVFIAANAIPVISDRVSHILGSILDRSAVPIDEAVEVYESCYGPNESRDFDTKCQPRLFPRDPEGPVPCKAACCNVQ